MRRIVAALLIMLLTGAVRPAAAQSRTPGTLSVRVLQGEDAVHNTLYPRTANIVIEVRDGSDFPIENADVSFELPQSGAGGAFAGGQPILKARTNYQGQAAARFAPNNVQGRFVIKVRVNAGPQNAELLIRQNNSSDAPDGKPGKMSSRWWWISIGAAAAVGVTLGLVLTSGNGSSPNVITINPGGPTVVRPRNSLRSGAL